MTCRFPTRREFLGTTAVCSTAAAFEVPLSTARSFWLFKLLRPECVLVHPVNGARLHCSDSFREWIVEGSQPLCIGKDSPCTRISGPDGAPVACALEIAGEMRRMFFGAFEFQAGDEYVRPVVTMDCETATGSILGAELPIAVAPFHALAAQAVVSRSFILGTALPQHASADFCDTTHCQFFRSPSRPGSAASKAVLATRGHVLTENETIFPARYSAACGGQTKSGFENGHCYMSVICEVCRERQTPRRGHGWGLCQEGAMELARRGFTWREILAKYYPNAVPAASSRTRRID